VAACEIGASGERSCVMLPGRAAGDLEARLDAGSTQEGTSARLRRALPILLLCLTPIGAASAGAASGPVVAWGTVGPLWPLDSVNGVYDTASAIAAGDEFSCATQASTSAVVCWGDPYFDEGQLMPPDAVNGVGGTASAIAAGFVHNCAIQAGTGAVVCWGAENRTFQTAPPDSVNGVAGTAVAIAAGYEHSCAIQAGTRAVVCWGSTSLGRTSPPRRRQWRYRNRERHRGGPVPQLCDPGGDGPCRMLGLQRRRPGGASRFGQRCGG
jgi:hypothetical protein